MRASLARSWLFVTVAVTGALGCRRELALPALTTADAGSTRPPPDGPPAAPDGPPSSDAAAAPAALDAGGTAPDAPSDLTPGVPDRAPDRTAPAQPPRDASPPEPTPPPPPPDTGPPPPPPTLQNGLVAHWRFDEGSGTRAADSSGNGNNAQLHNGTAWERSGVARGPQDFAVRLDGQDDYLSAAVGSQFPRIDGPKAIGFWFTADPNPPPSSGATGQRTCVALANPQMLAGIQVGIDRERPGAWGWAQNQAFVITAAPPPAGAHHLAYTFDGSTHRLYLDGESAGASTAIPQPGPASVLYVGTYSPPNELCAGQIDDLRLYDRPLTPAEIAYLSQRP